MRMSRAVGLRERLQQLEKAKADIPDILFRVAKNATIRAVEKAADATPPKAGRGKDIGTNTITGQLKAAWANDSKVEPIGGALSGGNTYVTFLKNSMEYASYVDQGHRMDKHFVPGLYINPDSGLLEYEPDANVGLVVGTKTKFVKGEFMVDKAKRAYHKTVLMELDKEIRKLMK